MQTLTILGSTGTIGVNTLDVVARHRERYRVIAVTAATQVDRLFEQCREHRPEHAVMLDAAAAQALERKLRAAGMTTQVSCGVEALEYVASMDSVTTVMAAIVGAAGLRPSLAAARAGKRVLLANKEALVLSGKLFMQTVAQSGALLLPIDSEHNALFQALPSNYARELKPAGIRRLILTASGGPFRRSGAADLARVTPSQACAHPNWVMGRKISVDSATMMNKGLEVIEAHWLFNAPADKIDVVIHPQSIVHSLVEYDDGSVIAQLGNPDMRTPIAYALAYPERIEAGVDMLDLIKIGRLDFEAPDDARFPCLRLAYAALREGGSAAASLNAANEIAVAAFLAERLAFLEIAAILEQVLERAPRNPATTLDEVLAADAEARRLAEEAIVRRTAAA